jgi:hypothetical protein
MRISTYILLLAPLLCGHDPAHGQWAPAGMPDTAHTFDQVWSDGQYVFYAGRPDGPQLNNSLARYANGQWDMLDTLAGSLIHTVVAWQDTLFVGGSFDFQNRAVMYRENEMWRSYGDFDHGSVVRRLRVLDDTLYAVGSFDTIDGALFNGVAKRVGGHWEPVGSFPQPDQIFLDIVSYRDTLVVIGSSHFPQGRGISYLAPGADQWQLLGPGILGGMSGAHSLAVYQDRLYVGGQISVQAGNAGQEIMRWTGTQFEPLGDGLQFTYGNLSSFCDVRAMVEHDGLLYVGGGCNYSGELQSRGVAIWDGEQWCSLPGDPTQGNGVSGMDFLGDTLFIACGYYADDQWVNLAAKYIGDLQGGYCTSELGVSEAVRPTISVVPTAGGDWQVLGLDLGRHTYTVVDALGRIVVQGTVQGSAAILPGTGLSSGSYVVRFDESGTARIHVLR